MAGAKMGELKRAAQALGVNSVTLREQGWKTASGERVRAVQENPPEWLVEARERRRKKRSKKKAQRERRRMTKNMAYRLGIQVCSVREHGIEPGDVAGLLADPPEWLVTERERRQALLEREARDRLRRELTDALVTSVHEVWFQELKRATTEEEVAAIDVQWTPEVDRARREARQLVVELTAEQVWERIDREQTSGREAAVYRARQLANRAFGGSDG